MNSENDTLMHQEGVFQWLPRVEDGPMRLEPSCIIFTQEKYINESVCRGENENEWKLESKRKGRILASNPILRSLGTFSFTVSSSSPNSDFAVGFTTRSESYSAIRKSVIYESKNGVISKEEFDREWSYSSNEFWENSYHKRQISKGEEYQPNDSIECILTYKEIGGKNYAAVQIVKDGCTLAKEAMQTNELVWPVIISGSSQTRIDIEHQKNESEDTSGTLLAIE